MFVILVNYQRPLDEVDALVPAHHAFLQRYYDSGVFLLSGRREPRDGGIILARADSRAELERIVSEDPFGQQGLATYTIHEFLPSLAAPEFSHLINA